MEDWENSLAYTLGGAALFLAGGLFKDLLYELNEDDKSSDKEAEAAFAESCKSASKNSLNGIVDIVRREAEAALAKCKTDEERQVVYAKIKSAIQKLQTSLMEKGAAIAKAVKEQDAVQENTDGIDHVANIYQATREAGNALDDMLAFLKHRGACQTD